MGEARQSRSTGSDTPNPRRSLWRPVEVDASLITTRASSVIGCVADLEPGRSAWIFPDAVVVTPSGAVLVDESRSTWHSSIASTVRVTRRPDLSLSVSVPYFWTVTVKEPHRFSSYARVSRLVRRNFLGLGGRVLTSIDPRDFGRRGQEFVARQGGVSDTATVGLPPELMP